MLHKENSVNNSLFFIRLSPYVLSALNLKLLPIPLRQHCPTTSAQTHPAAWIFSLAITASQSAVTDKRIAYPKKHVCLPTGPCHVWHTVAPYHVQTWREKISEMDWCWTAHRVVSMTSDLDLKMPPRKHERPFLHLLWLNVGQIRQWQSWEYGRGQIYPTWERKGYKWLSDCGEITLWKKDQDWTSLDFYRLTERIRKQPVALGWSDNLSCFKSFHWSNDYNRSLAARGQRRGIQSKLD